MRTIVFVNGLVQNKNALAQFVKDGDYLIGADGGTLHCLDIGRIPDVVVGDLDSLSHAVRQELTDKNVRFELHEPEKNETDLELAIKRAIADGATSIVLAGALGGRLDQMLSNLFLLAQRDWGVSICVVDGKQRAQLVRPQQPLVLHGTPGTTISAMPLSERVTGITYHGLKYPLTDATLEFGSTRGISNEVLESPAKIEIKTGTLLIIWFRNKPTP